MKRKLIVLIAAVLAVCCMAGLLSGCSVIVRNVEYIDLAGQGASAEYSFVDESLEAERLYPVSKGGTMYFVSADGDDLNDGLTPETPIKTLSKASSLSLKAGDSVLFRKGDTFVGNLHYSDLEGSKENPITIASYGEGDNRPIFTNGNETLRGGDIVGIYNSRGVVVRDFKIEAYASSSAHGSPAVRGIAYEYKKAIDNPNLDIYIVNNIIRGHDITGEYPDTDSYIYGITGYVWANRTLDYATDIYILNNDVSYVGLNGIQMRGDYSQDSDDDDTYSKNIRKCYKGVHLDGNTVHHIGQIGMYICGGKNCTMDRNLVYQTSIVKERAFMDGQCGMMYIKSEYSSARYNIIYDAYDAGAGIDGMGFDIDWKTDYITLEYNYISNCLGSGIGTLSNLNSTIAHNRLEGNLGATNHTGSLTLGNLGGDVFGAHIYDNLIYQTTRSAPAFRAFHEGGNKKFTGCEFVGNHIVLKADVDPSTYFWVNINSSVQFYKIAENKYYSVSPDTSFKASDRTAKKYLNFEEGAQVYKAGAGSPFSSWQKRDLGSTYEMRSDDAPSKVKGVTCTYENGKLLLNIAGDMSDVWHYNIYKVGYNESASYRNMIGQTESNTFEYDVPYTGDFFIIVQPESNQGIYGEGMKIRVNIGNKKGYSDLAGKEASAVYAFTDKNLGEEQLYPVSKGGTVYYVSSEGDDTNDGLTPETPIKTLSKASSLSLKAGDSVLFKKGDTFTGSLSYSNLDGTKENPITFASSGDGDERPVITNGNEILQGGNIINVQNSSGVVIRDLQVNAYASSSAHNGTRVTGIGYGVGVAREESYHDIYIVNNVLRAYDFSGEYPDADSNAYGISVGGWDGTVKESLTGVHILKNDVSYFGRVGIIASGTVPDNDDYNRTARKKISDIHIDGNAVHHIGQIGMYIMGGVNCTMDRNLVYQTGIATERGGIDGQCGIMYITSEYSVCRYNVVYDIYAAGSRFDAMGIDVDWNTDNITVEYNLCYNCLGDGIGTMATQNSIIAHNRIEDSQGATNHNASIGVSNYIDRNWPLTEEVFSVINCRIYDNLILHTNPNVCVFRCIADNGIPKWEKNEFVSNHIVLRAEDNISEFYWIRVPTPLRWYKFADNKYYSSFPDSSFKVFDKSTKKYINTEEGAQIYKAGTGSPFSSWQKRDLGATYEMRSDSAPSKVENVTCTYENGKLLLNIAGDMSDVWHYNIYKVGYDESASYRNMIGQTESSTFEYEVPHNGEFYIIIQPESNQGIYGEGFKIKINID